MAATARQTERSRQTDLRVAASAANAVRRDGIDQLALTRVAADAGYSSGVIYARCDDRSELMVLAWQKSFWPSLREVLDAAFRAATDRDAAAVDAAVDLWAERCNGASVPDIGSAAEVIAASRRDEVLAEVVHHDINELLSCFGAGPGTTGAVRELLLLTAATLVGSALLNSSVGPASEAIIDPRHLLRAFIAGEEQSTPARSAQAQPAAAERIRTGDDVRDALIDATEYVIARSGVHRATVSRIARRAGVSVGAIYGLYENKESLVTDCVSIIHPPQARRDTEAWAGLGSATDFRAGMSANLRAYLSPGLRQWRLFRIELLVAARHAPGLSRLLDEYGHDEMDELATRFRAPLLQSVPARGTIVGLALLETVDPTVSALEWRWFPVG
ncbi:MAG: TetR/AcrR family transcriptional regulator [Actinomycetota bacterium]